VYRIHAGWQGKVSLGWGGQELKRAGLMDNSVLCSWLYGPRLRHTGGIQDTPTTPAPMQSLCH